MMRYIDQGKQGDNRALRYILTLSLIFVVYIIGSFGLFIDYNLSAGIGNTSGKVMSEFTDALGENRVLFWLMIPFVLVFGAFLFAIKYIHKRTIKSIFTARDVFDWRRVFISFTLIVLVLSVTTFLEVFILNLMFGILTHQNLLYLLLLLC